MQGRDADTKKARGEDAGFLVGLVPFRFDQKGVRASAAYAAFLPFVGHILA